MDCSKTTDWQPMSEYPRDHDPGPGSYWGPTVLVRVPASSDYPYGPTHYVAHLEADMWLTRCGSDPEAWDDLHAEPDAWMMVGDMRNG